MVEEKASSPQAEVKISKGWKDAKQIIDTKEPQREETKQKINSEEKSPKEAKEVVKEEKKEEMEEKKEEIIEEKEEKKEENEGGKEDNHTRNLSSTVYFSSVSSFDNENERQIHVDPISLTEIGMLEDQDTPLSVPSFFTEVVVHSPILPPLRTPRFVSASLPCSATSSPHYSFSSNQRWDEADLQPHQIESPRSLARQHSLALTRFASGRSKSFGEGRTFTHNDTFQVLGRRRNSSDTLSSSSTTSPESPKPKPKSRTKGSKEDDFKCGALCMYIPGFSKKKPLQQLRQQIAARASGVSRLASLEKFDCGSWSPPCIVDYQDVPFEMERNSGDVETPVRTAFMFDGVERRGILKKSTSRLGSTKSFGSSASNRHVRFSVALNSPVSCPSSPSSLPVSISPRLRKFREDFNAFLEAAQTA
ncbi:hypothetical protein LUZ60_005437 [Juncus effusus]|nr:hypothetical protein LUZ60_005437 [Juncus effusus]